MGHTDAFTGLSVTCALWPSIWAKQGTSKQGAVNAVDMLDENGNYAHNNKLYEHFRKPGHSHCNMKIFVLEQCFGDENILKAREDYWIQRCNTVHKGLNTAAKL